LPKHRLRERERGQSVVEFALILPLLVFLMVAIVDLARVYTTMLSVEAAAREAADYGAFGSFKWDPIVYAGNVEPEMKKRACTAASNLPDYVGAPDNSTCSNPSYDYKVSGDKGSTWTTTGYDTSMACDDDTRTPPCWIKVTMRYDFHLFVPMQIDFLGVRLGIPDTLTIERDSIFAMTDLELP
jgi:hypothetical protein